MEAHAWPAPYALKQSSAMQKAIDDALSEVRRALEEAETWKFSRMNGVESADEESGWRRNMMDGSFTATLTIIKDRGDPV